MDGIHEILDAIYSTAQGDVLAILDSVVIQRQRMKIPAKVFVFEK